ncbi:SRPBCC family protein [Parahaliea maris]|uniref:SRPBCC family protein n=1 Tax=Parahaliea maris TaxID=2716870 RepID=A0A5C9A901_9GAMM|nr:SRPBCC family protein [Parahaliea maris]TXS96524.1 SRPBCC family protein [Parahaliea maris]
MSPSSAPRLINHNHNHNQEGHTIYAFTVEKTLEAPLEQVWAVVADFGNLDWFDGAERVEQVGEGVGQVRRVFMPGAEQPVEEKLLALDSDRHSIEYEVLEGAVNVMQGYRVVASLEDAGEGKTRARWEAGFTGITIEGLEPETMIAAMTDMYGGMLDAIAAEANTR